MPKQKIELNPQFRRAMEKIKMEMVLLEKIYRQEDEGFIRILNAVRNRSVTANDLEVINTRNDPPPPAPAGRQGRAPNRIRCVGRG